MPAFCYVCGSGLAYKVTECEACNLYESGLELKDLCSLYNSYLLTPTEKCCVGGNRKLTTFVDKHYDSKGVPYRDEMVCEKERRWRAYCRLRDEMMSSDEKRRMS